MPKPNVSYKDLKNIKKSTGAWINNGRAVLDFLPENGNDPNSQEVFQNIDKCMNSLQMAPFRNGRGALFFMCMLGQVDPKTGRPLYSIEDVVKPGVLAEEKRRLGKKIEALINPKLDPKSEDKIEKKWIPSNEANVRTVDTWMLRGLKRACEALEAMVLNNVKEDNYADFHRLEFNVLSVNCVQMLTNNIEKNPNNPGSFLYRMQQPYEYTDKNGVVHTSSVAKDILGKGGNVKSFAKKYEPISSYVSNIFGELANIESVVEEGIKVPYIHESSYIQFDRMRKNYLANPNNGLDKIMGSNTLIDLAKRYDEGQRVDESGIELSAFQYGSIIKRFMEDCGEPITDAIRNTDLEARFPRKAKYIRNYRQISENKKDPLYRYGLCLMAVNGKMYDNLKVNGQLVFSKNNNNQTICDFGGKTSVSFDNNYDRKTVLKEVFLSDMELGDYYGLKSNINNIKDIAEYIDASIKNLQKVSGEGPDKNLLDFYTKFSEVANALEQIPNARTMKAYTDLVNKLENLNAKYTVNNSDNKDNLFYVETDDALEARLSLDKDTAKKRKNEILAKVNAKPEAALDSVEKELYVHYVMQDTRNRIFNRRYNIEGMLNKAKSRKQMMENGARFPRLIDNNDPEIIKKINEERTQTINELNAELQRIKPSRGASKEWNNMCKTFEKLEQLSRSYANNELSKEQVEQLTSALRIAQHTARNYVFHKVDTNGLNGKEMNYKRLQCAKRIESFCDQHSKYLFNKMTMTMNSAHRENGFFSKESVNADYSNVKRIRDELVELARRSRPSKELRELLEKSLELQNFQERLANRVNAGGKLTREVEGIYYGYKNEQEKYIPGLVEETYDKVQKYIKHRIQKGNFDDYFGDRFDMALRLRSYLETIKNGAKMEKMRQNNAVAKFDTFYMEANESVKAICADAKKDLNGKELINDTAIPEKYVSTVREKLYTIFVKIKLEEEETAISNDEICPAEAKITNLIKANNYEEAIKLVKADAATMQLVEFYSKRIMGAEKIANGKSHTSIQNGIKYINDKLVSNPKFNYEQHRKEKDMENNTNNKQKAKVM